MTVTLDLDDELVTALSEKAAEKGTSVNSFAEGVLRQHVKPDLEAILTRIRKSGGNWSRDGRSWGEISHEGHKY